MRLPCPFNLKLVTNTVVSQKRGRGRVVQYNLSNHTHDFHLSMNPKQPFKWRHFQQEIILLNVRWYLGSVAKNGTSCVVWCRSKTGYFG